MARRLAGVLGVLGLLGVLVAGVALLAAPRGTTPVESSADLTDVRDLLRAEQAAVESFRYQSAIVAPGLGLAVLCLPAAGVLALVGRRKRQGVR